MYRLANSNLHQTVIPYSTVMAAAIENGVEVHCADYRGAANYPDRFGKRHEAVAECFREVSGQPVGQKPNAMRNNGPRCLILMGGAHFERGPALDQYIQDLPFITMG